MEVKFKVEKLDPKKAGRGVLCCVCGEYRFGPLETVVMYSEQEVLGVLCPDCVAAGPDKAAKLAYKRANELRLQTERQFRIADLIGEVPKSKWPSGKSSE